MWLSLQISRREHLPGRLSTSEGSAGYTALYGGLENSKLSKSGVERGGGVKVLQTFFFLFCGF